MHYGQLIFMFTIIIFMSLAIFIFNFFLAFLFKFCFTVTVDSEKSTIDSLRIYLFYITFCRQSTRSVDSLKRPVDSNNSYSKNQAI